MINLKQVLKRLNNDIEYLDDTYENSKTPPDERSIDYEFGNHELTLGDLKTIKALIEKHEWQRETLEAYSGNLYKDR